MNGITYMTFRGRIGADRVQLTATLARPSRQLWRWEMTDFASQELICYGVEVGAAAEVAANLQAFFDVQEEAFHGCP